MPLTLGSCWKSLPGGAKCVLFVHSVTELVVVPGLHLPSMEATAGMIPLGQGIKSL